MTYKETVQLGIEFERRLIEIDPSFEVENKPDTETIYAFLNQYTEQYFQDIIRTLMSTKDRNIISDLQDRIKALIKEETLQPILGQYQSEQDSMQIFNLPKDYYKYIRSYSKCYSTYNFEHKENSKRTVTIENKVFSEYQDYSKINNIYNDGFILRNPLVLLERPQKDFMYAIRPISVLSDAYTDIKEIVLIYYKKPNYYTIINTSSTLGVQIVDCELSSSCFWDIVKGAVDLYIYSYKFGVTLESLKRKARAQLQDQQNNAKQQQQQQEDDQ